MATQYNLNAVAELIQSITTRDIKEAGVRMGAMEARFLVDFYYIAQNERIRFNNQVRTMKEEPSLILGFLANHATSREDLIKKALDYYTSASRVGQWLRSIHGVGPVIAAGLLAHIDIRKAPTAGAIWKFAGIDGKSVWNKGEKRPWNAMVKTLATYKLGESFVKTSNSDKSFYGKIYKARKELETAKNLAGEYADQAAALLKAKKYSTETVTYAALSSGRLSDGHIHARARRYAVKIFLSHLHEVMYRVELNQMPPAPFAIAILGHAHKIEIPDTGVSLDWADPSGDDIEVQENEYDAVEGEERQPLAPRQEPVRSLSNVISRHLPMGQSTPVPAGMSMNEAMKRTRDLVRKYEAVARRGTFGAWVLHNHYPELLISNDPQIREFTAANRVAEGQTYLLGLFMQGTIK